MGFAPGLGDEDYCYLTTTGRVSGAPREIEIWFGLVLRETASGPAGPESTLYMLSGGGDRSDWMRNLLREPAVTVRIAGVTQPGRGRVVDDPAEAERARALLFDKYSARYGGNLDNWRRTALPVAVDF